MLLYLSSYKLGNKADVLKKWIKENGNKIVLIANSKDYKPDTVEKETKIMKNIQELQELGFDVTRLDLRNYFGKEEKLKEALKDYQAVYVIGGNVFTLRMAMKFSGFDNYIKEMINKENYLYAGYSAGICVLANKFDGLDIVDKPVNPYNDEPVLYDGLGILDNVLVPHYKSEHPESELVDKVVEFLDENKVKYKTLRDGDVEIINIK